MSADITRIALDAAERAAIEDAIEKLLAVLDGADGDCDLEPSLAGSYNCHHAYDAEGDDIDIEDGGDQEPSLGSFDRMIGQARAYRVTVAAACAEIDAEVDRRDSQAPRHTYEGGNAGLRSHAYRWHQGAPSAEARAALVLSTVGCDWRGTYA